MRLISIICVGLLYAVLQRPPEGLTFAAPEGAYAILRFTTKDAGVTAHAAALDVLLDGKSEQIVVVTPGV